MREWISAGQDNRGDVYLPREDLIVGCGEMWGQCRRAANWCVHSVQRRRETETRFVGVQVVRREKEEEEGHSCVKNEEEN